MTSSSFDLFSHNDNNDYLYDSPTTTEDESDNDSFSYHSDNDSDELNTHISQVPWSHNTEYIFVNQCLCLDAYGYPTQSLPSYAFYQDNNDLHFFWDTLSINDYERIYLYLRNTGFLFDDDIINSFTDSEIINRVISFRQTYFEY